MTWFDDNKVVKIKNINKGKFGDPLNLQTFLSELTS